MNDRLAQSEDEDHRAEQGELHEDECSCDTCSCENTKWGFACACEWEKKHPGTRDFSCEFCGLYTAGKPRCNKCEECD